MQNQVSAEAISSREATTKWFKDTCASYCEYVSKALRLATPELYQRITRDKGVGAAFLALMDGDGDNDSPLATDLLNAISLSYLQHFSDDRAAVAFGSGTLLNDFLDIGDTPDWIAFPSTIDALREGKNLDDPRDCSTLLGAGECALTERGHTHVNWWLSNVKRYRPDLATVYGMRFDNQSQLAHLSSFEAAGNPQSLGEPMGTLDVWIAHVLLLYETLSTRDTRFTYLGAGSHTARWNFKAGPGAEEEFCIEPVYSSPHPGKMTWAGLTTCHHPAGGSDATKAHGDEAVGFYKISWQNEAVNKISEGELLDLAHADSWLPGLVRPWDHWREGGPGQSVSNTDETRVKDVLHLASVGQPFSQCGSVREMLDAIFDATCTILGLCKRGIMHRDLSWYNVLIKALHDPALSARYPEKKVASVDEVPCIKYVLTGDRTAEPFALVTDLDLAVKFEPDVSRKYRGPRGAVGTPMFISLERASKKPQLRVHNSGEDLEDLKDKLLKVEKFPEFFSRAFPSNDGFDRFISGGFAAEKEREGKTRTPLRDYGHHPRHDVESLFWILYWGLARACPLGSDAMDTIDGDMSRFVQAMLRFSTEQDDRDKYFSVAAIEKILHPRLARFAPLLASMVRYLSVPWHRYHGLKVTSDIELYHAHIAFMRLLLEEIRILYESPELDVLLDTTQPRIRNLANDQALLGPGYTRLVIDSDEGTAATGSPDDASTADTSATVVPADGPVRDAETATAAKRKRPDDSDDSDDEADELDAKRMKADRPVSLTVREMADMFEADRTLWFSRGNREVGPKRTPRAANAYIFTASSGGCDSEQSYSAEA
ncbi:hypothetical protein AURDEDRAFT_183410 [Auricularia subglabra TFB-10046 SS5]|nr:hypothetical protein AURDEDRAFT_183410 [Auricularia subglabra TFB-10046 SS5]